MERVSTYRELLAQTPVDELEVQERPVVVFRVGENTWIEAIDVPARLSAGASLAVAVTVGSQRSTEAAIELRSKGAVLAASAYQSLQGQIVQLSW